jgi:hypothetical protein
VTAGSAIVTGTGTGWQTSGLRAGIFGVNGIAVPVASIDSDTQITLALEWPGATASGQEYWVTYDTEPGQQTVANAQRLAEYIARLNNPALAATASVTPAANKVLLFTGATTATLIDIDDLIQAFKFDAEVPTLAGRAAYDAQPKGFKVLVADIGDGRSAFYTKLSNTSADWSVPFYISGVAGPAGVANIRGAYAAGTAYAKNDLVFDNGSSWIAKVATTGNAPPTLPTTSNTWWQLAAAKGADGSGTGDVVGPPGGVTAKQAAGFGSATGKAIVGLTPLEARTSGLVGEGTFKNKFSNPLFLINQRGYSGTVTLAANTYGHDRVKAGASGCTYTFSINNGITTLNITAGSLQQVIRPTTFGGDYGTYFLSWVGTAQGRINGGAYGASGLVSATVDGSANITLEFGVGTFSLVQFEKGYVTPFSSRGDLEPFLCMAFFEVISGIVINSQTYRDYYYKVRKVGTPAIQNIAFDNGSGATFAFGTLPVDRVFQNAAHSSVSNFSAWITADL